MITIVLHYFAILYCRGYKTLAIMSKCNVNVVVIILTITDISNPSIVLFYLRYIQYLYFF